jgi:hypothetical protein
MGDRYDDLAAAKAAAQQIADSYEQNNAAWREAYNEGRRDDCVYFYRNARALEAEARELVGTQPQSKQAQAYQQFYQQYGFVPTAVELNILNEFPGMLSDPKKLAEARAAANSLVTKNFHDPNYRNSAAYDSALRIAIGCTASDGVRDGPEVASPDTVVETVQNSKYAKDFDRRQYDALAEYRDALKARGFYRMDDTP